jgi:hypothetical protein
MVGFIVPVLAPLHPGEEQLPLVTQLGGVELKVEQPVQPVIF